MSDPQRYYFGFSFDLIGDLVFNVTADGLGYSYTVTMQTGRYLHGFAAEDWLDLAGALETALNAAASGAGSTATWTVDYSNATMAYTVTGPAGWDATLNAVASNALGLPTIITHASDTTSTSTARPYYVIAPAEPGIRWSAMDHEDSSAFVEAVTDGGRVVAAAPSVVRPLFAWWQDIEPKAAVYEHAAVAAVPWTWQHAFKHARGHEIVVAATSVAAAMTYVAADVAFSCRLARDGAAFRPALFNSRIDTLYNVPLEGRILQRWQ